jgi:hypothetical protein
LRIELYLHLFLNLKIDGVVSRLHVPEKKAPVAISGRSMSPMVSVNEAKELKMPSFA